MEFVLFGNFIDDNPIFGFDDFIDIGEFIDFFISVLFVDGFFFGAIDFCLVLFLISNFAIKFEEFDFVFGVDFGVVFFFFVFFFLESL